MIERQQRPDLEADDLLSPATYKNNEETVRKTFWNVLKRNLARLPFADQIIAAYFAAFDAATPLRTKAMLLAALAYFVLPFDVVPDFILGLGFTDDMTVLATAFALIRSHVTEAHLERAREAIDALRRGENPPSPDSGS
jgi:uncharacterized membrane protein YkvA (DUF1232 family)